MIWGPDDQSILPAVMSMIEKGQFAWIGNGEYQTSTTHIDNLVYGVELALTKGRGGESYFITDEEISPMKKFLSEYISTQGMQMPNKSVPKFIARGFAQLVEFTWRTFRIKRRPPLVRFSTDIMSAHCTIRTDKAKRDLGYQALVSVKDGLEKMPRLK